MVARMIPAPAQEPITLTSENHPENAVPEETQPTLTLASSIGICALSALGGMTLGSAALSTAFLMDAPWHVACLIPLVSMLVCIAGGWIGAFFWMCREEASRKCG